MENCVWYEGLRTTTEQIQCTDLIALSHFIVVMQPVPARANVGAGDMFVDQECYITGWGDTSKINNFFKKIGGH